MKQLLDYFFGALYPGALYPRGTISGGTLSGALCPSALSPGVLYPAPLTNHLWLDAAVITITQSFYFSQKKKLSIFSHKLARILYIGPIFTEKGDLFSDRH